MTDIKVLKVKVQVNAVNKKAKGQNFENYEVYSFKCCSHHDQGQGVGLAVIHQELSLKQ